MWHMLITKHSSKLKSMIKVKITPYWTLYILFEPYPSLSYGKWLFTGFDLLTLIAHWLKLLDLGLLWHHDMGCQWKPAWHSHSPTLTTQSVGMEASRYIKLHGNHWERGIILRKLLFISSGETGSMDHHLLMVMLNLIASSYWLFLLPCSILLGF